MNKPENNSFHAKTGKSCPNQGHLFIISAPSGAGKTTLCQGVLAQFQDIHYSVSFTTRPPRMGERHGVDYHFTTKEDFRKKIRDRKWAEWAEVYGNYYGTCSEILDKKLCAGRDVLLDIDVQGTLQILERYPESVTIFILPPSLDALQRRLEARGTDSPEVIAERMVAAKNEMRQENLYRHVIVNDHLSKALTKLISVLERYRSR